MSVPRFENKYGNIEMQFNQNVRCFCPLGDSFYCATVDVDVIPDKWIPDYCDVQRDLRKLDGKPLILEDLLLEVYNYLIKEVEPKHLTVSVYSDDANHFPVRLTKYSE
jgi:hypothetical protein